MKYGMEIPLRAAITGIDGAGKSTTASMVADKIGNRYRIVEPGPSRPIYTVINGKKRYHFEQLIKTIDLLHNIADKTRKPERIGLVNAINVCLSGRVIEPSLIRRFKPDVVLGARDFYVDPSVYSIIYQPYLASKPMSKRIDFLGKITGVPFCNIVFFLTVSPHEAVMRIEKRIEKEKLAAGAAYREKWRHMHENPESLALLQNEYYNALTELQGKSPVQIFEINTQGMPQIKVADFIANIIRKHRAESGAESEVVSKSWTKIENEL